MSGDEDKQANTLLLLLQILVVSAAAAAGFGAAASGVVSPVIMLDEQGLNIHVPVFPACCKR